MIVLAIDTCGASGSIALARIEGGKASLLAQAELAGKTYSAQLIPAIQTLVSAQQLGPRDLQAIVVTNGPGSFTGIRIGVSTAKGLAEPRSIPLLAVSRLAVLAWKASANSAALDAGRAELYFRDGSREFLLAARHANEYQSARIAICEPTLLRVFPDALMSDPPTAADALTFAVPRLWASDFDDIAALDGNYLRRSDAEIFAKVPGKA